MTKHILIVIALLFSLSNILKAQNPYGDLKNYDLDIKIDYQKRKLFVTSELTILNETGKEISNIPIILYRLLKVTSIVIDGEPITYSQEVKSFDDFDVLQVNAINIKLVKPIPIGISKKIEIKYEGSLLGYSETGMSYIKDHIDFNFTILRPDCLSYPILGKPEFSTLKSISSQNFDYKVKVSVPESLFVVNGGILISKISENRSTTFIYKSIKPTSQIVITISKYEVLKTDKISTFYFTKDSTKSKKVHKVLLNTFDLYSKWWGDLKGENTFSLIEIPENYGSQATESYVIQTASAFNDENQLRQLYHEISHLWNVKSTDKYPTRWNEGLATFIEYKAIQKLEKRNVLDKEAVRFYEIIKTDKKYSEIALIDFGERNVTDRSYQVGFLFFYILHQVVGEETFNQIIKSFYQEYYLPGATTNEFVQHLKANSKLDLNKLCNDWIYSTNYNNYLKKNVSISELVKIYGSN